MQIPRDYIGAPILSLQAMLGAIGAALVDFPSVAEDGIYGAATENAVRAFQLRYDLPPTGQTNNETWNRIVETYTHLSPAVLPAAPLQIVWQPLQIIRPGEQNRNLYPIQSMLCALGEVFSDAPVLAVTGIHDAPSVAAVVWLQEKSGILADGTLSQVEWMYLTNLYRLGIGDGTSSL